MRRLAVVAATCLFTSLTACSTAPERLAGENWVGPSETPPSREFTPPKAIRKSIAGWAMLQCRVGAMQTLLSCTVLREEPTGLGFGDAALKTTSGLKISQKDGAPFSPDAGALIDQPIFFCPPEKPTCRAELKAVALAFSNDLAAVRRMVRAGNCAGALRLAGEMNAPNIAAAVTSACRAAPRPTGVGQD